MDLETRSKSFKSDRDPVFENNFIEFLLYQFIINNWSDIESIYFDELIRYKEKNLDPKILNDEFNVIKEYLSKYLQIEEKKAQKIKSYETLFNEFCQTNNALILSFNYTRTIENLYKGVIKCPIRHIHGELENKENPMIFGYAANHAESRELLSMNNNEYMKNIKKHLYKRTNNEDMLSSFLNKEKVSSNYNKIDVFLLGHSCGLSDNLILNEILNHKAIYSIKTFYYERYEEYFDIQVNVDRIMANDERFKELIVNFMDSPRMPQFDDNDEHSSDFKEYIKRLKEHYPRRVNAASIIS